MQAVVKTVSCAYIILTMIILNMMSLIKAIFLLLSVFYLLLFKNSSDIKKTE